MLENLSQISIKHNNKINPIFIRANSYVLLKNEEDFKSANPSINEKNLENAWKKTLNAELVKNNSDTWTHVRFNSLYDMSFFLIRYGP